MKSRMTCISCENELTEDEIGLHKKLINRGAEEFMCMDCLCEYYGITREKALSLIEQYRAGGCKLFN